MTIQKENQITIVQNPIIFNLLLQQMCDDLEKDFENIDFKSDEIRVYMLEHYHIALVGFIIILSTRFIITYFKVFNYKFGN